MRYTQYDSISVDTPEDRDRIVQIIKKNYSDSGSDINDNGKVMEHNRNFLP
jgi:hypothetical protein